MKLFSDGMKVCKWIHKTVHQLMLFVKVTKYNTSNIIISSFYQQINYEEEISFFHFTKSISEHIINSNE